MLAAIFISLGAFTMVVLLTYFSESRKKAERLELIKRGVNPEKYDIKLPGRASLPWGVLFLAFGLGFTVPMLVTGEYDDAAQLGFFVSCILAGIGLIYHWKVTAGDRERTLKIKEELILREGPDLQPDYKQEKPAE